MTGALKKRTSEEYRLTEYLRCKWADNIKAVQEERIKLAIVTANNHYAGFGPGTANVFRSMLWLPEAKWGDRGEEQEQEESPQHDLDLKQSKLSDFLD